ncbi:MAG: hypothetical protein AAFU64_17590 [Bacteroidota bacterium]
MENLTTIVYLGFGATFLLTVFLFFWASKGNWALLALVGIGAVIQALAAYGGFFLDAGSYPPRLVWLLGPTIILITLAFWLPRSRPLVDRFHLERYTWLHIIRVPIEVVLLGLFLAGALPQSMTFEGRNFDIFSGLTAPFIAYFGIRKKLLSPRFVLVWNFICLGLVLQVVITGILSVPSQIQLLSFDQPNVAVLYFPFVWLPGIIVPMVILGHLASIRRLWPWKSWN